MTLTSVASLARGCPKMAMSLVACFCFFWLSKMSFNKSSIWSFLACSRKGKTKESVASISLTRLLMALPRNSPIMTFGTPRTRHSPARLTGRPWSLRLSMPAAKAERISPACQRCSRLPARSAQGQSPEPPDFGCMKSSNAMQPVAWRRYDRMGMFSNFHIVAGFTGSSCEARQVPPKRRRSESSAAMEPRAWASSAFRTMTWAPMRPVSEPKMPSLGVDRVWDMLISSSAPSELQRTRTFLGPALPSTVAMSQRRPPSRCASTTCPASQRSVARG
mmetsp:Transcript_38793/g.112050  ORF Transcript_38793/g.112050 Transcript_38793/m.112050 type:complete len:276 (+) Transcript_38793:2308-3135(+)